MLRQATVALPPTLEDYMEVVPKQEQVQPKSDTDHKAGHTDVVGLQMDKKS